MSIEKAEEHAAYETQSRQVAALSAELEPMRAKVVLLKALLSSDDIEAKLVSGIGAGLEKLSSDDVEADAARLPVRTFDHRPELRRRPVG